MQQWWTKVGQWCFFSVWLSQNNQWACFFAINEVLSICKAKCEYRNHTIISWIWCFPCRPLYIFNFWILFSFWLVANIKKIMFKLTQVPPHTSWMSIYFPALSWFIKKGTVSLLSYSRWHHSIEILSATWLLKTFNAVCVAASIEINVQIQGRWSFEPVAVSLSVRMKKSNFTFVVGGSVQTLDSKIYILFQICQRTRAEMYGETVWPQPTSLLNKHLFFKIN